MCNHLYFQRNASDFVDAVRGGFIRQSDALAHIECSRVCVHAKVFVCWGPTSTVVPTNGMRLTGNRNYSSAFGRLNVLFLEN